jgi:hypothetical protein
MSETVHPQHDQHRAAAPSDFTLWLGVLGPPLVWAVYFQFNYALARWFCHNHGLMGLGHAAAVVALLLAGAAGVLAWRDWRLLGGGWPSGAESGTVGRSRFLSVIGMMLSALFVLLIAGNWLVLFFIDPCDY